MNEKPRAPYAEVHRAASEMLRGMSPDEARAFMREAGVLGITPQVGDKVRVLGRFDLWHYGIVVGTDRQGRVSVVHNDTDLGVVVAPLETFANGHRVQMVQRAPQGHEYGVAARAASLVGKRYDLVNFNAEQLANVAYEGTSRSPQLALGGILAAFGLMVVAVALSGDRAWDESAARYRDARGRFAAG